MNVARPAAAVCFRMGRTRVVDLHFGRSRGRVVLSYVHGAAATAAMARAIGEHCALCESLLQQIRINYILRSIQTVVCGTRIFIVMYKEPLLFLCKKRKKLIQVLAQDRHRFGIHCRMCYNTWQIH